MVNDEFLILKQKSSCDLAFHTYEEMLSKGVSRELARCHLPLSTITEFYWKINLHNLLHFLKLRMDGHAQKEIRDLANEVYELIKPIVPITCEAYEDFIVGSLTLTRLEIEAIRTGQKSIPGRGENQEFQDKMKALGLA
jgi:thymidylate synthase (FAD)